MVSETPDVSPTMESSTSSIPPVSTSSSLAFSSSPHLPDISIKLASSNYLLWKAQVIPILRGNGLLGYVQNQVPCPSQIIIGEDGESRTNPAAAMWLRTDQLILGWINSSLSDSPLSQVINSESSHDAWHVLETLYGSHTRDRLQQMKGELQSLNKGSSSLEDYLHKAKSLALSLRGAGKPMDDDEFIICILRGLGSEFDPIVAALNARDIFPPLEGVIGKLRDFEIRLQAARVTSPNVAFYTNRGRTNTNSRGTYTSRGRNIAHNQSPSQSQHKDVRSFRSTRGNSGTRTKPLINRGGRITGRGRGVITYFRCGGPNHKADGCFASDEEAEQFKAFAALQVAETTEVTWYPDTGANHHMTSDTNEVQGIHSYLGNDSVMVGNGNGLQISGIGQVSLPATDIKLNNVLIVPDIKKKLLSVSQLTREHNCYFIFYPWGFLLKDMRTKQVLLKGSMVDGLYPIQLRQSSNSPVGLLSTKVPSTLWLSCPGTPEQNGLAERRHRHIVDTGLTLMAHASIPPRFWTAAFNTAVFLINRLPTSILGNKSPYELVFGATPSYTLLRVFRSTQEFTKSDFHTFKVRALPKPLQIAALQSIPSDSLTAATPTVDHVHSSSLHAQHSTSMSQSAPCQEPPTNIIIQDALELTSPDIGISSQSTPRRTHPMITRAQTGSLKPKVFFSSRHPIPACFLADLENQPKEPRTYKHALTDPKWQQAMQDEIHALHSNNTWTLVPRTPDMNLVSSKWVFKIKTRSDGSIERYKARLVAHGFSQLPGLDYDETFSPVVKHGTIRLILTLALSQGSSSSSIISFISHLSTVFHMKDLGDVHYFLGLQITRAASTITITQTRYLLSLLQKFGLDGAKLVSTPMVSVNNICQFMQNPRDTHLIAVKRVFRYLKGTRNIGLNFVQTPLIALRGFCDADWAGSRDDRRSTTGFAIYMGDNLLSWGAKKQATVSRSTAEAEYRALASTTAELMWFMHLPKSIGYLILAPTLYCDNISAINMAKNPIFHHRTKHIEIDIHFVREQVARGTRRFQFLDIYVPLYQAALKGDWHAVEAILEKYLDAIRNPITKANDTALHIAALAERASFVRELVKRMNPADLELTNKQENMAICFAAASGIVAIDEEMVNKNGKLPLIRDSNKMTPLYMAALQGRRDMVSYLYSVTDFEHLTSSERIDILVASISADFYGMPLHISLISYGHK
ncbi:hypothetical protein F2P56_009355 [Juglans regia]|uniref:Uncharacterized protein n=1 Tax=Juglans regia TaxID=51240 RepID=A0A834D2N4_JUGRE|nr:hypothetical protein F2P56_009355 [Juglans regia]